MKTALPSNQLLWRHVEIFLLNILRRAVLIAMIKAIKLCSGISIKFSGKFKIKSLNFHIELNCLLFNREVNQGSAADFLPFLLPFQYKNMKKMEQWSHEIRQFILNNIITDRYSTWNIGNEPNDYIESLIDHVKQKLEPRIEWNTVSLEIFEF